MSIGYDTPGKWKDFFLLITQNFKGSGHRNARAHEILVLPLSEECKAAKKLSKQTGRKVPSFALRPVLVILSLKLRESLTRHRHLPQTGLHSWRGSEDMGVIAVFRIILAWDSLLGPPSTR